MWLMPPVQPSPLFPPPTYPSVLPLPMVFDFKTSERTLPERKRKMNTDNEESEEPNMITPARNLRPHRSRGIANTSKKTLKGWADGHTSPSMAETKKS